MATKKAQTKERSAKAILLHALFGEANPPPPPPVLQALIEEAGTFLSQTRRNMYQLGKVYRRVELVTPAAIFDKYGGSPATFWATFIPQDEVTLRAVQRWSRISGQWDWDVVSKARSAVALDLLLEYCVLKHIAPAKDPGPMPISFTPPKGRPMTKPFSECTSREMVLAVGRGDPLDEPDPLDPDDVKAIKDLKKMLRAAADKDDTWIKFGSVDEWGTAVLKLKLPLDTLPLLVVTLQDWAKEWTRDRALPKIPKPVRRRR